MGRAIEFTTATGSGPGYLAEPEGPPSAGLVVIQEWWGLNDNIRQIADRFAAQGFLALAPDLYHGAVTQAPDEAQRLVMELELPRAEGDLRGAIEHLRAILGRPVGTLGFCVGGALSLFAACQNGASVGACVVFYGGYRRIRYDLDGLRAPLLGHWAEHDDSVNARLPSLQAELDRLGLRYEFHHYAGARHAFFSDQSPAYDPEAAQLAFERTLAFLQRELGAGTSA